MVTATVIGDEALAAKFTAAIATLQAESPYWIHDMGLMVQESILDVINREGLIESGDLARSGRTFYQTANGISVGFGQGLAYAQAIEHGARPHPIVVTNPSGLLHFKLSSGEWFVGPAVNHPGNKPYKFVYRGALEACIPILMFFSSKLRAMFGGM